MIFQQQKSRMVCAIWLYLCLESSPHGACEVQVFRSLDLPDSASCVRATCCADLQNVSDGVTNPVTLLHASNNTAMPYILPIHKSRPRPKGCVGEIFSGRVNPFSRYENDKTKPPLALVKLLKALDRHPDLLNEVRMS